MEKPAKSRIASIDAIRALAVFGVVIIHCDLFRKAGFGDNWRLAGSLIDLASRVAVPFFMVAAGYFFGIKSREQCFGVAIVSTFARRLFIVFSFWYVFYIFWPADWRLAIDQGYWRTIYWDANALLHHTARLVIGPRAHLWFLSALLLGTIHVALIGRIAGWRLLMPYSVILYLLGLANGAYQAIPEVNAVSPRLWGNLALPPFLIALGWAMSQQKITIRYKAALGLFLLGSLLVLLEAVWLHVRFAVPLSGHDMLLGTPFQAVGLMALALTRPDWGASTPLPTWGRYTLGVYTAHVMILELFHLHEFNGFFWEFAKAPVIFATTIIMVMLLSRLSILRPVLV
jgi:surface polysaccharide O-acyltransferase-like enzyme